MKRTLVLATALCVAAALAQSATAAAPKPKPAKSTFYLHGTSQIGEQDQTILTGSYLGMDRKKPTGTTDKGKILTNYALGPNTACSANGAFAVWVGDVSGTISGSASVTFFTQTNPGATVDVRLFADADDASLCDSNLGSAYPQPLGEKNGVALPATGGKSTVTIPISARGKAAQVHGTLVLEILPGTTAGVLVGPQVTRVLYDSTTAMSSVTFTCTPKVGKKTC